MSSTLEDLQKFDIKRKSDGKIFLLTGHAKLLQDHHGFIFETEHDYPELSTDNNSSYKGFYNHFSIMSIVVFTRDFKLVSKVRPEGFVSSSTAGESDHFKAECDIFIENNSDRVYSKKLRRLDIGDGITFGGNEGGLYDLVDPAKLIELDTEVIKRLSIDEVMLRKLANSPFLTEELFTSIDEQMEELGCKYYTFERPDGGSIIKLLEGRRAAEIRAVGYKQKEQN